jgi:hypothetical protein
VKYQTVADIKIYSVACGTRGLLPTIRSHSKPAIFFRDRVQNLFVEDLRNEELEEKNFFSVLRDPILGTLPEFDKSLLSEPQGLTG